MINERGTWTHLVLKFEVCVYIYKNHVDCIRDSMKLTPFEIKKFLKKPQVFTTNV